MLNKRSSLKLVDQAFTVQLLEENLGSAYGNISIAPAPRDIVWQNMKSRIYLWIYYILFGALFLFISSFALSPLVFAAEVRNHSFQLFSIHTDDMSKEHIHKDIVDLAMAVLNSVLFFTFSLLTPYFVKVIRVKIGSQIIANIFPADDSQIRDMEQGEDALSVHHHLLHLGLWHHHPFPILSG